MNDLLELVIEQGASDLHLHVNQAPMLRLHGKMVPVEGEKLTPKDTEELMKTITSMNNQEIVKTSGGVDYGFTFMDRARFRVSVLRSKGSYGMVLRQISSDLFSLSDIGFPDMVRDLLTRPRGLILVTGPTGSGKSTTLASMLDWINTHMEGHIITIEDPIEYYHEHKKSIVTQREVGTDVVSFESAIRGAMRQDPDVILVGEMRDLETISLAMEAAITGHLVFATLHCDSNSAAILRLLDLGVSPALLAAGLRHLKSWSLRLPSLS